MRTTALPGSAEAVAFASPKQCQTITTLSPRQQDRLEQQKKFPRSIKLGEGRNSRKVRVLSEVLAWNADHIAERNGR